jgi:hypothetical protein
MPPAEPPFDPSPFAAAPAPEAPFAPSPFAMEPAGETPSPFAPPPLDPFPSAMFAAAPAAEALFAEPQPPAIPAVEETPSAPPPVPVSAPGPPPMPAASPAVASAAGATINPVVGWLVCIGGPDKGRDFRLHAEKNFIGRSPKMDVCIPGDDTVSREKHAVVVFDPKKLSFWAMGGEAAGLVYLNGEVVYSPTPMKRDDLLEIGQTRLVLIPFCGERYRWTAPA